MDSYDVVVVGAGTAGIPCAVAAADAGATVLLVDKADDIGGALCVSTAHMSAAGTRRQKEKGIEDSPDVHYDDVLRINHGSGRHDLIRLAIEEAPAAVDLLDEQGMDWVDDCPKIVHVHPPYSVARTVQGQRGGQSLIDVLRRSLEPRIDSGGVALRLGTKVTNLTVGEPGGVTGVDLDDHGTATQVSAGAIVLATGGYAASPEHFSRLHDRPLYSVAWEGATGDGLDLAEQAGGRVVGTDNWQPTFGGLPGPEQAWRPKWAERSEIFPQLRAPWEIYVLRDGRRFVAEDDDYIDNKERALAAVPDLTFFQVFDTRALREGPPMLNFCANDGLPELPGKRNGIVSGDTLDSLAAAAGIDAGELKVTVEQYNQALSASAPDPFGRQYRPAPIAEAPFYAIENHGINLISFGGVDVDSELRVVGDTGPVAGLFAVGEVLGAGAVSGNAICGGMLVTPALSLGRWLGTRLGRAAGSA